MNKPTPTNPEAQIPNPQKLPPAFVARMQAALGTEYPAFAAALHDAPPVSVRLNKEKKSLAFAECEPVKWCATGRYLPERPIFALDPLWHAGAYYVQEASSMLIETAIRQCVDLTQPLRVLDLCAAPGGKSTLLAGLLHAESLLVVNEVIQGRVGVLRENVIRWGFPNIVIVNHDPADFADLQGFFDVVLIDAPCSGEGLFRKDENAASEWSDANVQLCAARQQRIVTEAIPLLRENGILLYSTCTYNRFENDDNARFMIEKFGLSPIRLEGLDENGRTEYGIQHFPHQQRGEGFYLAVFNKKENTPSEFSFENDDDFLENDFRTADKKKKNKDGKRKKLDKSAVIPPFKSFLQLTEKQLAAVLPFIENAADYDFYIKPNEAVFALRKTLTEDYRTIDAALQRKQLGVCIGELRKNVFLPAHDLAMSPALLHHTIPKIALTRQQALLFLKKENLELADYSTLGWAIAAFEGVPLGFMKILQNRFNNYLPNELRIRMNIHE
jgi:16S rRNA C967 or C1407 C5-methylase (RsmB/RsmF family)/NOL1/NOP2/fmu family ribosome biogenesis protein